MFKIRVIEDGQTIGHMTVEEFRGAVRPSSREFLADTVHKFNAYRESINDPTRVEVVIDR